MSERQKQNEFVRDLIRSHESDDCRELQLRLARAEQNERCVGAALRLVLLLGLLSISGLGYSAVLAPEFFASTTPVAVQIFGALLLTSGICLAAFIALSLWYRGVSNDIYHECREFIRSHHKSRGSMPPPATVPVSQSRPSKRR